MYSLFFSLWLVPAADAENTSRQDAAIDRTYEAQAGATGGRVYDLSKAEDAKIFRETFQSATSVPWSARLWFSKDQKFALYAVLKWLAYVGWCFVGLGLAGSVRRRYLRAAGWGTARLLIGIGFGTLIFIIFSAFGRMPTPSLVSYLAVYLGVYLPVRWIEWSILAAAMRVTQRSTAWRLGGIAVSFFADAAQMALLGALIPTGRFLC